MLPVFIRPAKQEDGEKFIEWAKNQPEWDAFIGLHPGTFTIAAYNKEKVIAYLPVQMPFMYETFAPNPEATDLELAAAMKAFTQFLISQSYLKNVAEVYFLGSNDDTNEFATNHIFEKLNMSVYRVRISDLEPRPATTAKADKVKSGSVCEADARFCSCSIPKNVTETV